MNHTYRLLFDCPDQIGLVSEVTSFISLLSGWITESSQHSEEANNWFYSRIEIKAESLPFGIEGFRQSFSPLAEKFSMNWSIVDSDQPKKVAIFASKASHCLSDLLDRWRSGDLPCEISCVIANHQELGRQVECCDIPFHCVPVDKQNKAQAFSQMQSLIEGYDVETIVLARYMQILPEDFCHRHKHQVINIHHSFLPSFIGAKPYHQAFDRGVKLIGATCHYVTTDLDEGPIIDQDIQRVNHSDKVEDLVRLGKDIEKQVLARGLRYHLEDRIMVDGNKTIIF
ncbi:MAG: formyltetrahydrofolate deformylase [Gammaproteobacteria bacterium]|jgi:formyltetrahydrofolate deformylase|nr:formyltetrahydrofolate deformylase [Gammaproteobacteria bacterium]MBT6701813.1 formyltetrahydrofolate deformylase [Gammaproteobacteria bacterium]